ncbi:hypothetical protein BAUCODRAFT_331982 [Baudoinia panamericana UAMH 10762]|uniref:Uncharacterized protein n=1 Tax=Baudoinia panamericana (strain UAMH 10762) TaxID=717646 RepID=M2MXG3_BAUPA|nr:uncharacterized protein BAUCODRAFT_331982 [Baudoinia panamericana UAMH 10762]EMC90945.1 hypothetical protein BAUCODRAFT_331982 [Baudoinia panamericana UAMH 10762]
MHSRSHRKRLPQVVLNRVPTAKPIRLKIAAMSTQSIRRDNLDGAPRRQLNGEATRATWTSQRSCASRIACDQKQLSERIHSPIMCTHPLARHKRCLSWILLATTML